MSRRFSPALALTALAVFALTRLTGAAVEQGPSAGPMTLSECIQEALSRNPGLTADTARTSAAGYAADAARATRFPRLDLASDYSYSDRPQRLAQPSYQGEILRYDNDIAQAVAEVRVPLFSGGRLVARQRAAELAAAASRFNLFGSRQDLILNVTAAYLAAAEQRAVIDAIEASLTALKEQAKIAGAMKDVGRIAPLDLLKVEVRSAAVEQRRSKAERDGELISLHLAVLLGRDLRQPLPQVSGSPTLPHLEIPDIGTVLNEATALRPELNAFHQEVARRQAELTQVNAERWPSLEAFGRWTARSVVSKAGSPISGYQDFFIGGVTLKVPLWTSGELGARRGQARALLDEARERERAARLQVMEQVQREAAALAEASDRSLVAGKAAQQAREAFEIERANYELGRAAVNDVLDAQAALLDAELALAQARHDVAYAAIALAWAAGRDLEKALTEVKEDRR
jgi:outer membrane protein TolC